MTETEPPCELLEWDSAFFGVSIARARSDRLDAGAAGALVDWCQMHGVDCLYFLAADDNQTHRLLRDNGFKAVDERVTLRRVVGAGATTASDVRLARAADVPALREIAAVSHRDSRFYGDARFDRDRCDDLYRTWIERSCSGWADAVLVADREGVPAGYLTIHQRSPGEAAIGLLAVSLGQQRQGVGRELIGGALEWANRRGIERMSVVTQGRNEASLAFYRSAGFTVTASATWYHRWFRDETPDPR
jgi:dTDP-4-amino-4,6-dideoxy-D-galactose acyltransferase